MERRVLLARSLGDSDEEGRYVTALGETAEALGFDEARAQALIYAATHAKLCGRSADGLRAARRALELYERLGDLSGQFDSLFLLVEITAHVGEIEASQSYIDAMRERSTSLADRAVEARALSMVATALMLRQEYRAAFDLSRRSLEIYLATNDREGEAYSRNRLAATATFLGDYATALREFDRALEAYDSFGNKRGLALTHANRAVLLMKSGSFHEAMDSIERSNALLDVVHEKRTIAVNQVNASFIHLQRGDLAAAKSAAEKALQTAREIGFPAFEAAALANLGNAERLLGDPHAAIVHMEAGLALRRPIQKAHEFVDDLSDLTLAYVAAGRISDALAVARELESLSVDAFAGAMWPHYPWWAIAQGFAAAGKSLEAERAANRGREELERFAARIDDDPTRRSFLSLPVNQGILSAATPASGA
jgi:tetratricopeptide (TPR) repeat protein